MWLKQGKVAVDLLLVRFVQSKEEWYTKAWSKDSGTQEKTLERQWEQECEDRKKDWKGENVKKKNWMKTYAMRKKTGAIEMEDMEVVCDEN